MSVSHSSLWVSLSVSARQVEFTPDFCLPGMLCDEEAKSPPMCSIGGASGDFLTLGKINLMQSARGSLPPQRHFPPQPHLPTESTPLRKVWSG